MIYPGDVDGTLTFLGILLGIWLSIYFPSRLDSVII